MSARIIFHGKNNVFPHNSYFSLVSPAVVPPPQGQILHEKLFLLKSRWYDAVLCVDAEYQIYFAVKLKLDENALEKDDISMKMDLWTISIFLKMIEIDRLWDEAIFDYQGIFR